MKGLTARQKEINDFIWDFVIEHGYGPSYGDIQRQFEFKSMNAVTSHVDLMKKKGIIQVTDKGVYPAGIVKAFKAIAESVPRETAP